MAGRTRTTRRPARRSRSSGRIAPADVVLGELARAKAVIDRLFAGKALPCSCRPGTASTRPCCRRLPATGFAALSVFGRAKPAPLPHRQHTCRHHRLARRRAGGKDHGALVQELAAELRLRREAGSREAVGVLTHHLVHDEAAWLFLEGLFDGNGRKPGLPLGFGPRSDVRAEGTCCRRTGSEPDELSKARP